MAGVQILIQCADGTVSKRICIDGQRSGNEFTLNGRECHVGRIVADYLHTVDQIVVDDRLDRTVCLYRRLTDQNVGHTVTHQKISDRLLGIKILAAVGQHCAERNRTSVRSFFFHGLGHLRVEQIQFPLRISVVCQDAHLILPLVKERNQLIPV